MDTPISPFFAFLTAQKQFSTALKDSANPFYKSRPSGPYYIYQHLSFETNEVLYIGKGMNNRMNVLGNRSELWKKIVKPVGFYPVILTHGLSEDDAYELEKAFIVHAKSFGYARANVSLGGKGVTVEKRWWNDKISAALTGTTRPSGKDSASYKDIVSKDQILDLYQNKGLTSIEISAITGLSTPTVISRIKDFGGTVRTAGRPKRAIVCVTDNLQFESISSAAKHYSVASSNINKVLNGTYKHVGHKFFQYAQDGK